MTGLVKQIAGSVGNFASSIVPGEWGSTGLPGNQTGGTPGGIFSGSFDLQKILSTGLNLASAGLAIFGADQQAGFELETAQQRARALELESIEESLEAKREETRGKQEANNIMDEMIQTLAAQRVAFAGNGVDIGFGTPVSVAKATQNLANLQLSTTRSDAQIRALARRRQATALQEERLNTLKAGKQQAGITRQKGVISAVGTVAEMAQRRAERG